MLPYYAKKYYTINVKRFAGLNFHDFCSFKGTVNFSMNIFIYIYELCIMVLFKYFKHKAMKFFSQKLHCV